MRLTRDPGRFAGLLYVLTSIVGFFSMGYVPRTLIVHGDAAATAVNIAAHPMLFRLGIAGELVGQTGFLFVALALYQLLREVNQKQAVVMVLLIALAIPIALLNEVNAIATLTLMQGADFLSVLEKPQRDAMAMLFVSLHARGIGVAELFWGLWLFPLALLLYRSRFLPRFLGVWLALAGVAWVVLSLAGVLLPQSMDTINTVSQPALIGEIVFMLWLLIRGAQPPARESGAGAEAS